MRMPRRPSRPALRRSRGRQQRQDPAYLRPACANCTVFVVLVRKRRLWRPVAAWEFGSNSRRLPPSLVAPSYLWGPGRRGGAGAGGVQSAAPWQRRLGGLAPSKATSNWADGPHAPRVRHRGTRAALLRARATPRAPFPATPPGRAAARRALESPRGARRCTSGGARGAGARARPSPPIVVSRTRRRRRRRQRRRRVAGARAASATFEPTWPPIEAHAFSDVVIHLDLPRPRPGRARRLGGDLSQLDLGRRRPSPPTASAAQRTTARTRCDGTTTKLLAVEAQRSL